jgi:hypothetical protein
LITAQVLKKQQACSSQLPHKYFRVEARQKRLASRRHLRLQLAERFFQASSWIENALVDVVEDQFASGRRACAVIGKVLVTANGKQLGEAPVVALAGVERAGFFLRIRQHISGWFSK